jgi:hypothetical protein
MDYQQASGNGAGDFGAAVLMIVLMLAGFGMVLFAVQSIFNAVISARSYAAIHRSVTQFHRARKALKTP